MVRVRYVGTVRFFCNCNCNYILFTKLPWSGDSEGTFRSSSQAATFPPVYHTRRRLHTVSLIAERQAVNTNFCSLWFDPTGKRTQVYNFSSRCAIHSTTDRLTVMVRVRYVGMLFKFKIPDFSHIAPAFYMQRQNTAEPDAKCVNWDRWFISWWFQSQLKLRVVYSKDGSTVRYVTTVRYASNFAKKYGTLERYAFFVMVRVRCVGTVRFKNWTEVR